METSGSRDTAALVSGTDVLYPHTRLPSRVLRFWLIKHLALGEGPEGRWLGIKGPWVSQGPGEWGEQPRDKTLQRHGPHFVRRVPRRVVALCPPRLRRSSYRATFVIYSRPAGEDVG